MNKKALIFSRATGYGAPQRRIDNLISMLNKCGYVCYLVSFDDNKYKNIVRITDTLYHVSLGSINVNPFIKARRLLYGPDFVRYSLKKVDPDLVLIYSTIWDKTARYIKKICKKKNTPLIFDVVEFRYKPKKMSLKKMLQYDFQNWTINNKIITENDNVLCISHYLESFFRNKGAKTFYYPITFNLDDKVVRNNHCDNVVRFLYAGSPDGGRDLIANMISGFAMLDKTILQKTEFYICGPTLKTLISEGVKSSDLSLLGTSVMIKGKIPIDDLYSLMEKIDYTVLLKDPDKRFSIAGFPTKMVESFSKCIPMVCNLTGDMGYFAKNMENSIVCQTFNPQDFSLSLKKAVEIKNNHELYERMSQSAFNTVLDNLSTDKFAILFNDYLIAINNK